MAVDGCCATCHFTSVQAATDTTSQSQRPPPVAGGIRSWIPRRRADAAPRTNPARPQGHITAVGAGNSAVVVDLARCGSRTWAKTPCPTDSELHSAPGAPTPAFPASSPSGRGPTSCATAPNGPTPDPPCSHPSSSKLDTNNHRQRESSITPPPNPGDPNASKKGGTSGGSSSSPRTVERCCSFVVVRHPSEDGEWCAVGWRELSLSLFWVLTTTLHQPKHGTSRGGVLPFGSGGSIFLRRVECGQLQRFVCPGHSGGERLRAKDLFWLG